MDDLRLWRQSVLRVADELSVLADVERAWLHERLQAVHRLQRQLHGLFEQADGAGCCRVCGGACCERGRHHLTLVNLLGFLCFKEAPPEPDFSTSCPFLSATGCRIDVERRPFNCITFNCEAVENALPEASVRLFYQLEGRLRRLYREFDERYAGSSLQGLLIRAERLGPRPFLARC
ncbi:MAG: hypothetical protein P8X63_03630 [Desulfuromonadaceae bacterium]|jgi:hypothetical protein